MHLPVLGGRRRYEDVRTRANVNTRCEAVRHDWPGVVPGRRRHGHRGHTPGEILELIPCPLGRWVLLSGRLGPRAPIELPADVTAAPEASR